MTKHSKKKLSVILSSLNNLSQRCVTLRKKKDEILPLMQSSMSQALAHANLACSMAYSAGVVGEDQYGFVAMKSMLTSTIQPQWDGFGVTNFQIVDGLPYYEPGTNPSLTSPVVLLSQQTEQLRLILSLQDEINGRMLGLLEALSEDFYAISIR
jgi:hypothetical protein